jgi:hypothetical protein
MTWLINQSRLGLFTTLLVLRLSVCPQSSSMDRPSTMITLYHLPPLSSLLSGDDTNTLKNKIVLITGTCRTYGVLLEKRQTVLIPWL